MQADCRCAGGQKLWGHDCRDQFHTYLILWAVVKTQTAEFREFAATRQQTMNTPTRVSAPCGKWHVVIGLCGTKLMAVARGGWQRELAEQEKVVGKEVLGGNRNAGGEKGYREREGCGRRAVEEGAL